MHSFKKAVAALVMAGVLATPAAAFAQTSSTTSIQALLSQIAALQAQIAAAQQQQNQIMADLVSQMKQGSRGDQVKLLQQMLASDPSIYPEGTISGYYGYKTWLAIKRFQKKHGIEQAGYVGPKTLKKLNEIFGKKWNMGSSTNSGSGSNNSGHGNGRDHDDDDDDRKWGQNKMTICHKPTSERETKYVTAPSLFGHLNHGDTMGACSGNNGGGSTTTPDTTAPVISAVVAGSLSTTGATITWTTNENSTTQVEFGTTTSYGATSALNASLVTAHSVVLTGLTPNTVYNFRVWSKDAANNTATSSNMTFTTVAADTAAPVLSAVAFGSVATTTATISWTSNENATGKVYYGTANPLVLGSAATQSNGAFSTAHAFPLSGLTASTTYHFVVESTDAAGNTATSSQMSFTTTN